MLAALATLVTAGTAAYTVERGDTLTALAARHGTTVRALAEANGLGDPDLIFAGETLELPGGGGTAAGGDQHVVAAGETLSGVAARHGLRVADVAAANGLSSPYTIYAGQRLTVPAASRSTASPASAPAASGSRAEVGALIDSVAGEFGWDPAIVKALAWQESGWNNGVVSSAEAIGIMQVLPSTGEFVEDHLLGRELDLSDPQDNVTAGVAFLDYLHRVTGGDVRRTLGGYYQGLRSIDDNGVYRDTEQYIDNVLALRDRF